MAITKTTRLSARFLSEDERVLIADRVRAGASLRAIGRELGRPASTVSREVRRNRDEAGRYRPFNAHRMALRRLVRPKKRRLASDPVLQNKVQGWLDLRWSPEQIAHTLRVQFPDNTAWHPIAERFAAPVIKSPSPCPGPCRGGGQGCSDRSRVLRVVRPAAGRTDDSRTNERTVVVVNATKIDITFELFNDYYKACSNWGRWGSEDQRGTLNFVTPEKIVEAGRLVRQGRALSLQLPLDGNGPQTGASGRVNPIHQMVATGTDHLAGTQVYSGDPLGWGFADDSLFLFLQGGTQWDALGHIFRDGQMYNGFSAGEVSSKGALRGGVENMPSVVSRGVLLDMPAYFGVDHLAPGHAIQPEDLDGACAMQKVTVGSGDVVLIRTGDMKARRWQPGWAGYSAGDAPGLSLTTAPWFFEREVAALATDTWGAEVRPNELAGTFQPLHLILIVSMGLLVGEIWQLDDLAEDCAADGCYEFLFVGPPLLIPGAVGSPLNPQAIK